MRREPSELTPGDSAAEIVSAAINSRPPADRQRFLRELLAHAAAGLVVMGDDRAAAEDVYRLADAISVRKGDGNWQPTRTPNP